MPINPKNPQEEHLGGGGFRLVESGLEGDLRIELLERLARHSSRQGGAGNPSRLGAADLREAGIQQVLRELE